LFIAAAKDLEDEDLVDLRVVLDEVCVWFASLISFLLFLFLSKSDKKIDSKNEIKLANQTQTSSKTTLKSTKSSSSRSLAAAMNNNDPNKLPGNRPPFTFYPATVVGDVAKADDGEAPAAKGDDVDAISTASSSPMAGPGLVKQYKYNLNGIDSAFCETKCKAETFTDLKGEPLVTCVPLNGGETHVPHSSDPCFMCTDAGGTCALAKTYESFVKTQKEAIDK
jgi:hypothetical protein